MDCACYPSGAEYHQRQHRPESGLAAGLGDGLGAPVRAGIPHGLGIPAAARSPPMVQCTGPRDTP
jgi:hypothetical protein